MAVTETVQEILPNNVQTDPDYVPEKNSESEKLSGNEEQVIIAEEPQNGSDKVLTRKRNRNPTKWKQNIRKSKRQRGEAYLDSKGTLKPPKNVKNETCHSEKCGFKCSQAITNEERGHIHRQFWKLNDEKKVHFYSKHIKRVTPLRKRTAEESSRKKYSYEYHFVVSGVKIRVCQEYFLNTLNISKNRVYYFFKKNKDEDVPNSPTQGKHKKKFIPVAKKDEVRSHIKSFPSIDSHYCRALTKKKYLERGITLRKMYDLYRSSTENPVKFHMYSEIFNTEFNISFFKPKKDLCDKCELFKILKEPTEEEIVKQEEHIKRKNIGKQERDRDRKKFIEDDTVGSKYSKGLEIVEQKFSEPGHGNVQEIDCAHSCIEKHIRNLEIWSPMSLVRALLSIPSSWKFKFKVLQMKQTDYFNFQKMSKLLSYGTIPYTRVKHIIYTKKDVNNVEYKEMFEGGMHKTKICVLKQQNLTRHERKDILCDLYNFSCDVPLADLEINISDLKRQHLTEMKSYIPHDTEKIFYETLLAIKNTPKKITTEKKKNKRIIINIVFCPTNTTEMIESLRCLIKQHHELFISEFKINLIPKHHMMLHYPNVILKMGPLVFLNTMRFEAKHGTNLNGQQFQEAVNAFFKVPINFDFTITNSVKVSGNNFQKTMFVVDVFSTYCSMFCQILEIIVFKDIPYLICKPWKTCKFNSLYNAWEIQKTNDIVINILDIRNLLHFVSYEIHKPYNKQTNLIVPKFKIVS
ncbi:hypothetical protein PPYR_13317 [Photinus pyralis]|uniref:Uncharacterized protein n=1 Tax=Photinus pyralis TaxID=7054 RepID=A0A5N4A8R7_PHOPY|nr:hypothetical protein PPYR_13317 [Photinus pyralis]